MPDICYYCEINPCTIPSCVRILFRFNFLMHRWHSKRCIWVSNWIFIDSTAVRPPIVSRECAQRAESMRSCRHLAEGGVLRGGLGVCARAEKLVGWFHFLLWVDSDNHCRVRANAGCVSFPEMGICSLTHYYFAKCIASLQGVL